MNMVAMLSFAANPSPVIWAYLTGGRYWPTREGGAKIQATRAANPLNAAG